MRTGSDYRAGLSDGRAVFVDGERVGDVTEHPAFAGAISTVSAMYDFAADRSNGMQFESPETGRTALKPFMTPRSREDLEERRGAVRKWAELTHGFVGRSPDHVGSLLAGFASHSERFDGEHGNFGANVRRWYERLLDESLYLTYTIVPPPSTRSTAGNAPDGHGQVAVVGEDADGITVRGAQMLGTATAIADHVFVSCIKPISPDFPEHAVSFIVPVAADGLELHCRRSYSPDEHHRENYPLSARYDDSDALVVFHDVHVPWNDVLALRDISLVRDQFFETPGHVLANSQASGRLAIKLEFILGIAHEVCRLNGVATIPAVVDKLSELSSIAAMVEGMTHAADTSASLDEQGVMVPNRRFLYALLSVQAQFYSRVIGLLRELVGGGIMIVPPSSDSQVDPAAREAFERYLPPGDDEIDRGRLMKLAWDVLGSEFAGRHHQYETFYAGAPTVSRRWAFDYYGMTDGVAAVEQFVNHEMGAK